MRLIEGFNINRNAIIVEEFHDLPFQLNTICNMPVFKFHR